MINQASETAPLLEYQLRSIIMGLEFISPQKWLKSKQGDTIVG